MNPTVRPAVRFVALFLAQALVLCAAIHARVSVAAPVLLDCRYPQLADERGLRDADTPLELRFSIDREANTARVQSGDFSTDLELQFAQRHVTLFQTTASQGLYITAIVFDAFDDSDLYRSVHSRHAMIGSLGELRPSQHYGRCEPVASEGAGGD